MKFPELTAKSKSSGKKARKFYISVIVRHNHDNAGEFLYQDYKGLGITDVRTSPHSPDMNAYAERFIGSVQRECLDWFILLSYKQINRVLSEYIDFYNTMRPHQGIMQDIPKRYTPGEGQGRIVKKPVLSGLWHHYYREAA